MPSDLVRVSANGLSFNVGRSHALAKGLQILDESAFDRTGRPKPVTRDNGRRRKPRKSVAELAASKKTSPADPVEEQEAASEPADTNPASTEEN